MPSASWVNVPKSPRFANPSQGSLSSQSDSENSPKFRLSDLESAAFLVVEENLVEGRRAKVMTECAASLPVVYDAILHIVHSHEWENQEDISADLLLPIVEAIHFPSGGRSGSGSEIDRYRCLWGTCTKIIKRRDHMLNHVRNHLGLKPWVCSFTSADAERRW